MGAYAYPIIIKREKQEITSTRYVDVTNKLCNLDNFSKLINENETFSFINKDSDKICLVVNSYRLETNEELTKRVSREEKYMENYNKQKQIKWKK